MKAMTTPRSKGDNRPTEAHQAATLGDIERHYFGLQMGPGSGLLLVLRRSARERHQPEETPMKTLMAITSHATTCFTHFDVPIGCGSQRINSSIGTTKNDNMQNRLHRRHFWRGSSRSLMDSWFRCEPSVLRMPTLRLRVDSHDHLVTAGTEAFRMRARSIARIGSMLHPV